MKKLKSLDERFTLWQRRNPWQFAGFLVAMALCILAAYLAHRQPVLLPIAGLFLIVCLLFFAVGRRTILIAVLLGALQLHAQPLSSTAEPLPGPVPVDLPREERGWPLLIGCLLVTTGGIYIGLELYCMWEDHRPPEPPLPLPTNNVPPPTNSVPVVEPPPPPPQSPPPCSSCNGPIVKFAEGWAPSAPAFEIELTPNGDVKQSIVRRIYPRPTDKTGEPGQLTQRQPIVILAGDNPEQLTAVATNWMLPGSRVWHYSADPERPQYFFAAHRLGAVK